VVIAGEVVTDLHERNPESNGYLPIFVKLMSTFIMSIMAHYIICAIQVDAIEMWCVSTDAGSDVKGCRDLISSETEGHVNKLVFQNDCMSHQYHIIVFCLLFAIEDIAAPALGVDFKIYSTMAQICHLWRDNIREVCDAFLRVYGDESKQLKSVCKVPPRPMAGRWGRASACIGFLLTTLSFFTGDWKVVQKILIDVFSKRSYFTKLEASERAEAAAAAAATAAAEAAATAGSSSARGSDQQPVKPKQKKSKKRKATALDETAEDENKAWEAKMGKWAKGGVRGIQTIEFWVILMIANVILSKLDVLQHSIMKKRDDVGNLANLLYSGGETVMDLLEQLLTDDLPWRNVHIFVEQNCPERLAVVLDISKRLSSIK